MRHEHRFVDTNIIIYAHDHEAGAKHTAAKRLLTELWNGPYPPAISAQVLHELYVNLLRRGLSDTQCTTITMPFLAWEVVPNDSEVFIRATDIRARWKISFWDALILSAAERARAKIVWSEDLQSGQKYGAVTVINPL